MSKKNKNYSKKEARVTQFDGHTLSVEDIAFIADKKEKYSLSTQTRKKLKEAREKFVKIAKTNIPIYGVTTGYGEMINILIDKSREEELQTNLIRSHSAGTGKPFSLRQARAILACRINALSRGYSAVREELVDRMLEYLNENIIAVIPEIGSLGASGDLSPLAHLAVTLIGEGYVFDKMALQFQQPKH